MKIRLWLPECQLCRPRNSPFAVNTLSQPGNKKLLSWFHSALSRSCQQTFNRSWD
jgi:hypothetical protein